MNITPFTNNPKHHAELVDLINFCQNFEAELDSCRFNCFTSS